MANDISINAQRLWCVVPAAGHGARFGSEIPKQYTLLAGKPLLLHTLERLAAQREIIGLVVVIAPDDPHWPGYTELGGKPVLTAMGADRRADSVLAGLAALPASVADKDFVLVHDAARPCVRHADITRLIQLSCQDDGGLLAAPVQDTLKVADAELRSASTEAREMRWRAFTPQLFRRGDLVDALENARQAGVKVTDEAMALERVGKRPRLIEGSDDNIKITTRADLALAEFILGRMF